MENSGLHKGNAIQGTQFWHIHWQAAIGRNLLPNAQLPARIKRRLIDAHRKPGLSIISYTILPGEIHTLSLMSREHSPSQVARSIGNVVSRWVREAEPVQSPVFSGSYCKHEILTAGDLRDKIRMLAWRPVQLGLCRTPSHYPQASLRAALGLTPSQGFDARPMLLSFGLTVEEARSSLRQELRERPSQQHWRLWELTHRLVFAEGSRGPQSQVSRPVEGAAARLVAAAGANGIDGALRLLESWVGARLSAACSVDLHLRLNSVSAQGRAIVARLAGEHRLCSASSVARHFGVAKATLSEQISRSKVRESDQRIVSTDIGRIIDEAAALGAALSRPSNSGRRGVSGHLG